MGGCDKENLIRNLDTHNAKEMAHIEVSHFL